MCGILRYLVAALTPWCAGYLQLEYVHNLRVNRPFPEQPPVVIAQVTPIVNCLLQVLTATSVRDTEPYMLCTLLITH